MTKHKIKRNLLETRINLPHEHEELKDLNLHQFDSIRYKVIHYPYVPKWLWQSFAWPVLKHFWPHRVTTHY